MLDNFLPFFDDLLIHSPVSGLSILEELHFFVTQNPSLLLFLVGSSLLLPSFKKQGICSMVLVFFDLYEFVMFFFVY